MPALVMHMCITLNACDAKKTLRYTYSTVLYVQYFNITHNVRHKSQYYASYLSAEKPPCKTCMLSPKRSVPDYNIIGPGSGLRLRRSKHNRLMQAFTHASYSVFLISLAE